MMRENDVLPAFYLEQCFLIKVVIFRDQSTVRACNLKNRFTPSSVWLFMLNNSFSAYIVLQPCISYLAQGGSR